MFLSGTLRAYKAFSSSNLFCSTASFFKNSFCKRKYYNKPSSVFLSEKVILHYKDHLNIYLLAVSLKKNIVSTVVQNIISGICIFLLYKYLIKNLGMQRIGIYSILLSITGALGAFNAGFSGSLVRYVSIFTSESKPEKAISLIGTLFTSLLAFFTILVTILNINSGKVLKLMNLSKAEASEFDQLLFLASLVFLLGVLGGVFLSALEGLQKVYLKNYIVSTVSIGNLIFSILLIPYYELKGLFYALLISNCIAYLVGWILLQIHLGKRIFIFPIFWKKDLFKQTFQYNITFQLISISSLFYDPLLRVFLVRYEGLTLAGSYELANKLISQIRGILVAINQSLVPVFAGFKSNETKDSLDLFSKSHRIFFIVSNLVFGLLASALPFIYLLWIGSPSPEIMALTLILIPGWLINTIALPVYFANIGMGQLKPILFFHLSLAVLVPVFCLIAVKAGLIFGVVFSWSGGLIFCGIPIIFDFFYRHKIPFSQILPKGFHWILISQLISAFIWIFLWNKMIDFKNLECILFGFFTFLIQFFSFWRTGLANQVLVLLKK